MAGFDHGSAHPKEVEDDVQVARRSRIGLRLFAVYCAAYGAFMLLNAFAPKVMETTFGGVNLAIWYGFGLIGGALVLALLYAWLCLERPESLSETQVVAAAPPQAQNSPRN